MCASATYGGGSSPGRAPGAPGPQFPKEAAGQGPTAPLPPAWERRLTSTSMSQGHLLRALRSLRPRSEEPRRQPGSPGYFLRARGPREGLGGGREGSWRWRPASHSCCPWVWLSGLSGPQNHSSEHHIPLAQLKPSGRGPLTPARVVFSRGQWRRGTP